jgi:hypothetical protein
MGRFDQISDALAAVRVPVFLGQVTGRGRVVLHSADRSSAGQLKSQAEAALRARDISANCRVVLHKPLTLARKRSLEAFGDTFGQSEPAFDPTGVIGRTTSVVACATTLRDALGAKVRGVFLDTARRALFVILDRGRFSDKPAVMLEERLAVMRSAAETVATWRTTHKNSIEIAVRIGFDLPADVALVPVDRRSERFVRGTRFFDRLRKPGLAATLASIVGLGSAAQAVAADYTLGSHAGVLSQPEPAVAAPNIGLIGAGGWLNGGSVDDGGWGAVGLKATVPLSEQFGAQLDAGVGADSYSGIGGHLFWRDPAVGMLGLVGSYETMDGVNLSRVAVEGEIYKNDFTLRGEVGGQSGTTDKGAFGSLDLTFYATPNFSLSVGGEFGTQSLGRVGVEWQPAVSGLPGLSLFADGEAGSNGYGRVLAGVKYYFGTSGASLKDRDRRYDPGFSLFNTQSLHAKPAGYAHPI